MGARIWGGRESWFGLRWLGDVRCTLGRLCCWVVRKRRWLGFSEKSGRLMLLIVIGLREDAICLRLYIVRGWDLN